MKVDKDIILKKSVLSDYIYEYSKKRFIEKYNLGRIRLLYGKFKWFILYIFLFRMGDYF